MITPFSRLCHWDHPGRDTNDWQEEMKVSTDYMMEKWGEAIWSAWVTPPFATYRSTREALWEALGVRKPEEEGQ